MAMLGLSWTAGRAVPKSAAAAERLVGEKV